MLKPRMLRKTLTEAVPEFRNDPDKLHIFIERGNIISSLAPSLSHEYQYTLSLVVTDFGGDVDTIMVPVLSWLRVHQHDGMANPDLREEAFRFEVDILSNESCDIEIALHLTERVNVKEDPDGILLIKHVDEPPTPYDNHGPFAFIHNPVETRWEV